MPEPTQAVALSEINPGLGQLCCLDLHLLLGRSQKQCKDGDSNQWTTNPQIGLFASQLIGLTLGITIVQ